MELLQILQAFKQDGWSNIVTGMGTSRDKTTAGVFRGGGRLGDQELSLLYHEDDIAAKIADIPIREMLGCEYTLAGLEPEQGDELKKRFKELELLPKVEDAGIWGRVFGGCLQVVFTEDGSDMREPLVPERVRRVLRIENFDRRYAFPWKYYQSGPKAGLPEVYGVTSIFNTREPFFYVHESRCRRFGGARTDVERQAQQQGWDDSVYQRVYDSIRQFGTFWKATEHGLSDWNQAVYKLKGFLGAIAGNQKPALLERLAFMDLARSFVRAIVLDSDGESFEKNTTSFSGVSEILNVSMYRISSAAEIPATRLFGRSPAGMNATGDSDERTFYTTLKKERATKIDPNLLWLAQLIAWEQDGILRGKQVPFSWAWGPFVEQSPKERAEERKIIADTDKIYLDAQVVLPEEIATSRFRKTGWNAETEIDLDLREAALEADKAAAKEGTGGDRGAPGGIELAPTDMAKIITVNEARANLSTPLPPLKLPDGTEDPDGNLTMSEFEAKKKAAAEPAGTAEGEVKAKEIDPEGAKKKEEAQNNPPPPFGGAPPPEKETPPAPPEGEKDSE